jgi:large subunit ribosomal protein L24
MSNTHPKDLIKTHKIYKGDLVQVVTGKRDLGKQGKVIDVIKDKNLIVVEGVGMAIKHLKPNPFYPKGGRIQKETPIHYSRVQLVDPTIKYYRINTVNQSRWN